LARSVPSQLLKPLLQVPLQFPRVQVLVATLFDEHPALQFPQLLGSVSTFTLQPLARSVLSQFLNPVLHVPLQLPPLQLGVTWFDEQAALHPPQLLALLSISVSQPSVSLLELQSSKLGLQAPLQTLPPQVTVAMWLDEQAAPHPPQLFWSVEVSEHAEEQHSGATPWQATPHALQSNLSLVVSTQMFPQHVVSPPTPPSEPSAPPSTMQSDDVLQPRTQE